MFQRDRHPLGARVGTSEGLTRRMQGETETLKERRLTRRDGREEDSQRLEELS